MVQTDKTSHDGIVLQNAGADYVASAAKSALGMVPFAGSILAEIAGNIIPNQRIDRIVKYAQALESRLLMLEKEIVNRNMSDDNFTDLIEESLRQASRSLTDERRDYISSLVANSISSEDIEHYESKHLLRILGELNDVEIIWLRFYLDPVMNGDIDFREKHANIINPTSAHSESTQPELDKSTLQNSYKEHLSSLGLLEKKIDINTSGRSTKLKTTGFTITSLGRLLLREVGFNNARIR
ncbi:hypothetical protein [Shewanella frigidimarina]|uniref:hypothetical protein n=1 Tax=Shewanella frigidimarina TaxID=56812 RepID=UPI003D79FAE4